MYRKVEDFITDWSYEKEATLKMFNNLTPESLSVKVTNEGRELGFIAWHIVASIGEMMQLAGIEFADFDEHADKSHDLQSIISDLERFGQKLEQVIQTGWTDADLVQMIPVYGESWPKGGLLKAVLAHTIHHRGQMTILMRQAGLKVPGVYGPSREEWADFGQESPK
ncbi:MAG: DinB family protein [Ignavibacteria bacterium]|nr:DinB family protein [Ignavibacteria bacterium]